MHVRMQKLIKRLHVRGGCMSALHACGVVEERDQPRHVARCLVGFFNMLCGRYISLSLSLHIYIYIIM